MPTSILISGGAGYIGSHAAFALRQEGFEPVVIDDLSTGNAWAVSFGPFEQGDIGDPDFVRAICEKYKPLAAMHFAAFIEVGESVKNPAKYTENNREKASIFFKTLSACGIKKVVFSSTAAVYGNPFTDDAPSHTPIPEHCAADPITPYGQSKLEAEAYLRMLDVTGLRSVSLRYFNVAGAAPIEAQIGEAHAPESHLIPRLLLTMLDMPKPIRDAMGLQNGFSIYGNDYPTKDGTAVRDYIHVLDLVDAHIRALAYLLKGGGTSIFNLGSGKGYSVLEIVDQAKKILELPDFKPVFAPKRAGDPPFLVASNAKAEKILGWKHARTLKDILTDAIHWHRSPMYQDALKAKLNTSL